MSNETKDGPHILTIDEVTSKFTRCSKAQLYRMIKGGLFPPPLQLSAQHVGWNREEVLEWLRTRQPGVRRREALQEEEV
jgi:predicted DNA-binding transcriptional regulator AlpA